MGKGFDWLVNFIFAMAGISFFMLAYYDWKSGVDFSENAKLGGFCFILLGVKVGLKKLTSRNRKDRDQRFKERNK